MKLLIPSLILAGLIGTVYYFYSSHYEGSLMNESTAPTSDTGRKDTSPENFTFFNISTQTDCANECSNYRDDSEQYSYCRSICGFTLEEGVEKPPTSTDPTLLNDYKLKERAIRESDIGMCLLIGDTNIRVVCQTRVTEDLLEE